MKNVADRSVSNGPCMGRNRRSMMPCPPMNRNHATREAWQPQTREDREAVSRELEQILASPHFSNSKRYPALLSMSLRTRLRDGPMC